MRYDAFEIHNLVLIGRTIKGKPIMEITYNKKIDGYAVYGHLSSGGIECLADFKKEDKVSAEHLYNILTELLKNKKK